jgi:hypothetical protein
VYITIDASKKNEIKIEPVIVHSLPQVGVKSVPRETSEILTNHFLSVNIEHELTKTVPGFCGDNCSTKKMRKIKNNVFFSFIRGNVLKYNWIWMHNTQIAQKFKH